MSRKKIAYADQQGDTAKEGSQFIYSLILIFLIPILIIINTFWSVQKFQKNIETELQKKTVLAKTAFVGAISDSLDKNDILETKIQNIVEADNEFSEITILKPVDDGFQAIASSNNNNVGLTYKSLEYTSSWVEGKDITSFVARKGSEGRYWIIVSPIKDINSQKTALLNMRVSTADIDTMTQKTLGESLILLAITIFFVLLLLSNHFHIFEYALLIKRLREVDKMKDDFISMASHELKTPMAAIKGYMSMIFEGVAGSVDEKAKIHLEKILANIKRLDALVDALLDVSRLEQGRMRFDMQAVDVATPLQEVVSEIKIQADEKKIKLEYQPLPEPRPLIFADPERLAQVLENVIGNAIKYTVKGKVSIYHRVEEDHLKIIVQDTGVGMSKQDMKDLFTRFYRIKNEKTADIPGTGLGLWITKEIVLRMNGQIYAESREGIGSAFTIIFPIMREPNKQ
ncbi:MAG: HAMP domain-containing sensor histidine kinase [Patescibacteria group bacterium]